MAIMSLFLEMMQMETILMTIQSPVVLPLQG